MATAQEKIGVRGARTRERILEVAEHAFADNGFAETRLEDVASQLGITRAALVYYFETIRIMAIRRGVSLGWGPGCLCAFSARSPLRFAVRIHR